jgi:hypothetical protein
MYLLDSDVIWALRGRGTDGSDDALFGWATGQVPETLFASVISLMEFENGARLLERKNKQAAAATRQWIEARLLPAFEGRILPIDEGVAGLSGRLGYSVFRDAILAATTLQRGLVLATGTPANFRAGKVKTFNPWTYAAEADSLDWRRASQSAPLWLKNLFVRA